MKSPITRHRSIRCKFKGYDTIEVCVVDHDTGEVLVINFDLDGKEIAAPSEPEQIVKTNDSVNEQDVVQDELEESEVEPHD